jgi:hypothetical protein
LFLDFKAKRLLHQLVLKQDQQINDLSKILGKAYMLLDVLYSGSSNALAKSIYCNLRNLSPENMPKGRTDLVLLLKKISEDQYQESISLLKKKIIETENEEEKELLSKKLSVVQEMKTMFETVDENSSTEYIELISRELFKSITEFSD